MFFFLLFLVILSITQSFYVDVGFGKMPLYLHPVKTVL